MLKTEVFDDLPNSGAHLAESLNWPYVVIRLCVSGGGGKRKGTQTFKKMSVSGHQHYGS